MPTALRGLVTTVVGFSVVKFRMRPGEEELDGIWIHVDADALDGAIMSAVDDPSPDGLVWGELAAALGMAIGSGLAVGLQITIYNPDFDESGANGRGLATTINTVLSEFV